MSLPTMRTTPRITLGLLIIVASLAHHAIAASSCSSGEEVSFSCPNCGGISVSDCSKCDGYLFTDYSLGVCYDRTLFSNVEEGSFLWVDIVGTIIWFLTSGIATACGVGGGGIYVPLGILLLRFPPKSSSGLSQASIFGAALGGLLVNVRNRHPDQHMRDTKGEPSEEHPGTIRSYEKNKGPVAIEADRAAYLSGGDGKRKFYTRPVIDYDMALFLAPTEMAGAVLGVIIQRLFPDWLFVSFAAIVLALTSYKTFGKFKSSYKKDKEKRETMLRLSLAESQRDSSIQKDTEHEANTKTGNDSGINGNCSETGTNGVTSAIKTIELSSIVKDCETDHSNMESDDAEEDPIELEKRRHFLQDDSRQYPKEKIAYLILLWVGLTVITFLKGGKGVDSVIGITCEDAAYYALVAAQFLWTLGFATVFGIKNMKRTQAKMAVNYPFLETDVLWDAKKMLSYSFFTFFAGIIAGLIGIGGGMVLGPLMLVMGVHPSVSTATTASMVLLTSSSVAVMFVMSGLVPWEYAVYFFAICLVGAYIGKTRIDSYIKRTGMASILIGCLAAIIGLATVGCLVILFLNLDNSGWCLDGFKPFCVVKKEQDACPTRLLSEAKDMFPY
eukprot:CCRYP_011339-RB/>CCRYP_011339-RB protein AED:0.03 eAED:0.03 QI:377/1/1/1/1/1/3/274/612